MRQTDWYEDRVIGGLMAYWIYQHLGNLSPAELAKDETYQRVCADRRRHRPSSARWPSRPRATGPSRFSFCRDLGPARLIMIDARTGRQLEPGERQITTDEEWDWVESKVDGEYGHLLIASSLPFLLPYGMHHIEAWSEAVTDGAWGKRMRGLGEKVRIAANLDHWACFQHSYRKFEDLVIDVATGKRGTPPDSMLLFGGDVHHCWVTEVELPDEAPPTRTADLADRLLRPAQGAQGERAARAALRAHPTRHGDRAGRSCHDASVGAAAAALATGDPAALPQPDRHARDRRRRGRRADRARWRAAGASRGCRR